MSATISADVVTFRDEISSLADVAGLEVPK